MLGKPQVLFDQPFEYGRGISIANYDVLPDGRFVMLRPEPGVARHRQSSITVILWWCATEAS